MSAINLNGPGAINLENIQGMDLETALLAVQNQRATLLEDQLKGQIEGVQQKNTQIAKLNQVLAALNTAAATAPAGAKPTDKVDLSKSPDLKTAMESANISSLPGLEKLNEPPYIVTLKDGTKIPVDAAGKQEAQDYQQRYWAFRSNDYSGAKAVVGIADNPAAATKGDLDAAIQTVKSQIDSLSNTQQMDMLRLQSLSNKRNEAFETMTNFIKKMQDNRSSIVGNMR